AIGEIPSLYFRVSEAAGRFAALNLTVFGLTIGSTAYLMLGRGMKLSGLLGGMLIGQGFAALFGIAFTFLVLRPGLDSAVLRPAIRYSVPFIPHMIGNSLMVGVDRWTLEYYGMRDALGLYTLATQLTTPIQMATNAWNEASSPRFLAAWRDGGDPAARRMLPRVVFGFIASSGGVLLLILLAVPL